MKKFATETRFPGKKTFTDRNIPDKLFLLLDIMTITQSRWKSVSS